MISLFKFRVLLAALLFAALNNLAPAQGLLRAYYGYNDTPDSLSDDGQYCYFASPSGPGKHIKYDFKSDKYFQIIAAPLAGADWHGDRAAVIGNGDFKIYNMTTKLRIIDTFPNPRGISWSDSGSLVALSYLYNGTHTAILDTRSADVIGETYTNADPQRVSFKYNSDNELIFGSGQTYDLTTKQYGTDNAYNYQIIWGDSEMGAVHFEDDYVTARSKSPKGLSPRPCSIEYHNISYQLPYTISTAETLGFRGLYNAIVDYNLCFGVFHVYSFELPTFRFSAGRSFVWVGDAERTNALIDLRGKFPEDASHGAAFSLYDLNMLRFNAPSDSQVLYDVPHREAIWSRPLADIAAVHFHPGANTPFIVTSDGHFQFPTLDLPKASSPPQTSTDASFSSSFASGNGTKFCTTDDTEGTHTIYRTADFQQLAQFTFPNATSFSIYRTSEQFLISDAQGNCAVVNWHDGSMVKTFALSLSSNVEDVSYSAATDKIYYHDGLHVFSAKSEDGSEQTPSGDFAIGEEIKITMLSPNGDYLLCVTNKNRLMVNIANPAILWKVPQSSTDVDACFSPDSKFVLLCVNGVPILFAAESGTQTHNYSEDLLAPVYHALFHPSGRYFYGYGGGSISEFDVIGVSLLADSHVTFDLNGDGIFDAADLVGQLPLPVLSFE